MSDGKSKPFVVIFAGAGASKAVSKEGYPTTLEFFSTLPPGIKQHPLFTHLMAYLQSRPEVNIIDIEVVLWALQELSDQLKAISSNQYLLGWLMQDARLSKWRNADVRFEAVIQEAATARGAIATLISDIDTKVYELYRRAPTPEELQDNWTPLLVALSASAGHIELVTTNYDVVPETALDILAEKNPVAVDTAWRGTIYRKLDQSLWSSLPSERGTGLLTKLHGSVNWARDGGEVLVGDYLYKGAHERHVIIYPGFKGRPQVEPFVSMHRYFGDCVRLADALLFVGFSFRDEFINDICDRSLQQGTTIVLINPADQPSLPWLTKGSVHHIKDTFSRESAVEAARLIAAKPVYD